MKNGVQKPEGWEIKSDFINYLFWIFLDFPNEMDTV